MPLASFFWLFPVSALKKHLSEWKLVTLVLIIIIMEICKAPTSQLKALNKHNITHIMCSEMDYVINNLIKN